MTRAQKVKIALVVILVILLAALGYYLAYYNSTHQLSFNISATQSTDVIQPPQFLYSFSGTSIKLQRPIGVFVDGDTVYACDSVGRDILVFNQAGNFERSFGTSITVIPLNIARNPKNNELYVTDRRLRKMLRFDLKGKYLGDFNPNLPKNQLPKFNTGGVPWEPVTLCFAPDGTMYVTEILNGHRLLIFGPDGTFQKSIGYAGLVTDAKSAPGAFQFPNGIVYHKGLVYVTDSNNGRVQVFDKAGNFKSIIVTQGLPRGIDFLNRFPSDQPATPDRFVVADTLSHDATIWTDKGAKILTFGEQGFLDGQFSFPNGVSVGSNNKIFIADTSNGRIQVWGWPAQVSPVPLPTGSNWWMCLLPLLLLPLLLLLRRKKFFATADFIRALYAAEELDVLTHRRRTWFVTEQDYERLKGITQGDVELEKVLQTRAYSDSDVKDLMDKMEIDKPTAIVLTIAKRIQVLCTENPDYRRLAKSIEVHTVVNRVEFLERFEKRSRSQESADHTDSE
ncbi:MAG: hypothetical protein P4L93_02340 [Coriobacteriia bacterium]|nr:hypothetical protein [Coriobacteriia bacterium]